MGFVSTKKFGPISTGHRNWHAAENVGRNSVHCSWVHGYSRYIQFTFKGDLDDCGWVWDFGHLKFIKEWLDLNWDHKVLVSSDDPQLDKLKTAEEWGLLSLNIIPVDDRQWGPGIEGSCKMVFDIFNPIIEEASKGRAKISKVEIWEHDNNSAAYIND